VLGGAKIIPGARESDRFETRAEERLHCGFSLEAGVNAPGISTGTCEALSVLGGSDRRCHVSLRLSIRRRRNRQLRTGWDLQDNVASGEAIRRLRSRPESAEPRDCALLGRALDNADAAPTKPTRISFKARYEVQVSEDR